MSELAERLKRAWDENDDLWVALHDAELVADAADVAESFFREELDAALERQRAEFVASLEPLREAMKRWPSEPTFALVDAARALLAKYPEDAS